ncbi:MAG: hypothetical protein ABI877_05395 [Gemmatimonadaceae bacterium]
MNCPFGLDDEPFARLDVDNDCIGYRTTASACLNSGLREIDDAGTEELLSESLDNSFDLGLILEWRPSILFGATNEHEDNSLRDAIVRAV